MIASDARHLGRMLDCISAVRSQSASLWDGVGNLDFLLAALEGEEFDEAWVDEFTSNLATLDEIGTASADQIATMGSQYGDVVTAALDAIERLVRSRLPIATPPPEGDWDVDDYSG